MGLRLRRRGQTRRAGHVVVPDPATGVEAMDAAQFALPRVETPDAVQELVEVALEFGHGGRDGGLLDARAVEPRASPVHEAAWCPYCVAWLGTYPSEGEARAYERELTDHPFEFCAKRIASLNGSEEWRLHHEAGKRGSLAASKPTKPRVPADVREEASA